MKDEKEMNASAEKSNEELEATLDKTEEYAEEELHDELEKLAETSLDNSPEFKKYYKFLNK